jgi:hypothetical protein
MEQQDDNYTIIPDNFIYYYIIGSVSFVILFLCYFKIKSINKQNILLKNYTV